MPEDYDFSGWATRNNLRCSDGRVILRDAFKDNNGTVVPLVWNHQHNDPGNVLGHALLENRDQGVYAYCKFNDTESGKNAKMLVDHGDVSALSIYANKLKQQGSNVLHGAIREVSLVLAGANPGAFIDTVMAHGDDPDDEEAIIYSGEELDIAHSNDSTYYENSVSKKDESEETVGDVLDSLTEKQRNVVYALLSDALSKAKSKSEDNKESDADKKDDIQHSNFGSTIEDVINSMDEDQKNVTFALVGEAINNNDISHSSTESKEMKKKTVEDIINSMDEDQKNVMFMLIGEAMNKNNTEDTQVKHNVFDNDYNDVLSHSDIEAIFDDARRIGSMKEAFLEHGIENIGYLYPDDRNITDEPIFISREDSWVKKVVDSVHHTPFSRVRSLMADITADEARARGYMKGNQKKDEIFSLLRRSTQPTTVYKKQKIDRDDQIDITDFDVVAWMKKEMRKMLDEELARAYLIGDGRLSSSDDKINEQCIRPIWKDADLFTIKFPIEITANATDNEKAKAFIKACVKSRKLYKGSGNPMMFTTEDMLTAMLMLEDLNGHFIYDSVDKLAQVLRCKEIVTVPVMEGKTRYDDHNNELTLAGIYVNLQDYNVGADQGGSVNMFDDFDIDFNAQKYLIETRCSGAMTVPYGAVALEFYVGNGIALNVRAADSDDTWLGKGVSELQTAVNVNEDYISGTLHYVTGYTEYSTVAKEQSGNYLALEFETESGATTTVELVGSGKAATTLDSDNVWIGRITNPDTQTVRVVTKKSGVTVTKVYGLNHLVCETE
jgi:HK97 family phage prohead protease